VRLAERFNDAASVAELAHHCGVIVVSFDRIGLFAGIGASRLNQVRSQGSLRKKKVVNVEIHVLDDAITYGHERITNDGSLLLRVNGFA